MYISNINTASVNLVSIEGENIPQDEKFMLKAQDDLVIIYVNKGAANYVCQEENHSLTKRNLLLVNPEQSIVLNPIRKMDLIIVRLSGVVFTSSLEIGSTQEVFTITDRHQLIKHYLDLAMEEDGMRFRGSDIILKKLSECMLVHILRHKELSIKDAGIKVKHDEITKVQTFIQENYADKVTLDDLSELVNINKYYLIRLFKQKTGLSPIDYLINVRLAQAEKLLVQTNITISKISDMIGFHSPSHFSKTFRETNHMTPSAFRKKNRA